MKNPLITLSSKLAIEAEGVDYIEKHKEVRDESGYRLVIQNGHLPARVIQSGAGPIPLQQPRIHDRREGEKFNGSILPPYMRRSPSIEDLIMLLYLKEVSTNTFGEALESILGPQAIGISPSTISRLKEVWEEVFPATREKRCWVHKTANILDKMLKKIQPGAKGKIFEMYMAPTKKEALEVFNELINRYKAKYPKSVKCLEKDKNVLFTIYDFPAEHWTHIRTLNPIKSTFATVRHRHRQTEGCCSRTATLTMVFKLARSDENHWRKINSYRILGMIIKGIKFIDGIEAQAA